AERLFEKPRAEIERLTWGRPLSTDKPVEIPLTDEKGESLRILECHAGEIYWENESAYIVSMHDVTDRKKLDELKDDFVSSVSHELRTPLTIVREGASQVVDGLHGAVNEAQKKFLTKVVDAARRLGRMIDNLLDVSKLEAGKMALSREQVDMGEV